MTTVEKCGESLCGEAGETTIWTFHLGLNDGVTLHSTAGSRFYKRVRLTSMEQIPSLSSLLPSIWECFLK
jgi:hypothetical protein